MGYEKPLTDAERAVLRAQGLRPRTFWLPDTSTREFKDSARRSCEWLWERVPEEEQAMAFIEAMTDDVLADIDGREAECRERGE